MPPLSLGLDEAVALALGADYVAQALAPAFRLAAASARTKIEATVPKTLRAPFEEARRSIRLVGRLTEADAAHVGRVRDAIAERRVLDLRYRGQRTNDAAGRGDATRRVAPYGLAHVGGRWYLVGHSYERDALRRFRLSRIESLEATADRFELPEHFELDRSERESRRDHVSIRVAFAARELAAMRERLEGFEGAAIAAGDGGFVASFTARDDPALARLVLSWGAAVRILEPDVLRDAVRAEAAAVANLYAAPNESDTTVAAALV